MFNLNRHFFCVPRKKINEDSTALNSTSNAINIVFQKNTDLVWFLVSEECLMNLAAGKDAYYFQL